MILTQILNFSFFKVYYIFILFDGYFEVTNAVLSIKDTINKELDSLEEPVIKMFNLMTCNQNMFFFITYIQCNFLNSLKILGLLKGFVKFVYYIIVYYESHLKNENTTEMREIEVESYLESESDNELSSFEESEPEYSINYPVQNLSYF